MGDYTGRAAQLRAFIDGETVDEGDPMGTVGYLPELTGETVKADGQARRVALYDFEVAHRANELEPLTITPVKAGDVALLSQEQADRLERIGFVQSEADYKTATGKKTSRKA